MTRGYRKKNNLNSILPDVVNTTSQLPWWGSLLLGVIFYLIFAQALCGHFESFIENQTNSTFAVLIEVRINHLARVCNWVGIACFFAGLFFSFRKLLISRKAQNTEKGILTSVVKIIARHFD